MNRKKWLIASLVGISAIFALFCCLFYLRGIPSAPVTESTAVVLSVLLIIFWIDADRKGYPHLMRPFDFGFLLLIFWLPYLPYYLCRTRGAVGLLMFAGFLGLWWMGFFAQLLIYFREQLRRVGGAKR